MKTRNCQVLVIGGGPGGYPAAIRAGQLGLDVIIVDKDGLGGTCLNRGCIPSKAVIHAASKFEHMGEHASGEALGITLAEAPKLDMGKLTSWKDGIVTKLTSGVGQLLKTAGAEHISGWAKFSDAKTCVVDTGTEEIEITAEHVILATGSVEVELPFMPFSGPVIGSTEALDQTELPNKLVVVGAGYIGLELGIAMRKLGSDVTFIEAAPAILPIYDKEITRPITMWLKKHKVAVNLSCKAKGVVEDGGKTFLEYEDAKGGTQRIEADKILVAVGRKACLDGWGVETMGLDMVDGRFIKVDDQCRTGMRNVWAIGDVIGEPLLAHKATAQGEMVAELIAGHRRSFDPVSIAAVCFTEPEIVGVGLTPDEAKAKGEEIVTGKFPLAASGRYLSMEAGLDGGFVRVTARKDDHVILGIHAVGTHVSELSGEFALAIEMGARLEDIAGTIHVHPTLTEGFAESVLTALGHPIHIPAPKK
jgi:dihydrolipoamide dehydrogenase